MLKRLDRFRTDIKGVAAIEFALVFPVCIAMFFGVVELCNFNMQSRRAAMAVSLAAEYSSRDEDGMMAVSERWVVEDIWMIVNPTAYHATLARGGQWANGYSRALASVAFKSAPGCTSNCNFKPDVQWSFLYQDDVARPIYVHCDLEVVANATKLNGNNIRIGATGRAPVVIADFTYPYKPIISGFLFPELELHVNAVRKTRNGAVLEHESDSFVTRCD